MWMVIHLPFPVGFNPIGAVLVIHLVLSFACRLGLARGHVHLRLCTLMRKPQSSHFI